MLALIGSHAEAADLEILKAPPFVSPSPRWNGFYVGINGGGGLGPSSQTCQRRSKNASAGRSKNTSAMLAIKAPELGPFLEALSLGGIVHRRFRAGTA